jgi:hypothetical protein
MSTKILSYAIVLIKIINFVIMVTLMDQEL